MISYDFIYFFHMIFILFIRSCQRRPASFKHRGFRTTQRLGCPFAMRRRSASSRDFLSIDVDLLCLESVSTLKFTSF